MGMRLQVKSTGHPDHIWRQPGKTPPKQTKLGWGTPDVSEREDLMSLGGPPAARASPKSGLRYGYSGNRSPVGHSVRLRIMGSMILRLMSGMLVAVWELNSNTYPTPLECEE